MTTNEQMFYNKNTQQRRYDMQSAIATRVIDTSPIIKLYGGTFDKPKTKQTSHKVKGVSSEVYAFQTIEEINAMIGIFDKHIADAITPTNKQIWHRNKLMFIIGINIALRGSDLSQLRYSDFLEPNGKFKDNTKIIPQKTKKLNKFVFIHFNDITKNAIKNYIEMYPYEDISDFVFASKKTKSGIAPRQIWSVIKTVAAEAGIKQNIGSHSLRKTFGYWVYHDAENKTEALVMLQRIFNHSSTQVTLHYIGITENEMTNVYDRVYDIHKEKIIL